MRRMGLLVVLLGVLAGPVLGQGLRVGAVRLGVVDYDESIALYRDVLGCAMAMDAREDGYVYMLSGEKALVLTEAPARLKTSFGRAHVRVNFSTPDLDAAVRALEGAGMRFETRAVRAVDWVRYAEFYGPSGNPHTIMEMTNESRRPASTVLSGCSVSVSDMDEAVAYYGDMLGIGVGRKSGPLVSMEIAGGSLTLDHDVEKGAATRFGETAWAGMAFEVDDIERAMGVLRERGVRFLEDAPIRSGPVYSLHAHDPFGNVIELIQHVAPAAAEATSEPEGEAEPRGGSIERLGWLSGTWRYDSPQGPWFETWGPVSGGAIAGMMHSTRDGGSWLFELFTVQEVDGEVRYSLRHFDPGLVPWKSEANGPISMALREAGEHRVVFEDLAREWPQRLVYTRDGDTLVARLEGEAEEGERVFELRFGRVEP